MGHSHIGICLRVGIVFAALKAAAEPEDLKSRRAYSKANYTFATIYVGNSPSKYLTALMFLGVSLLQTGSIRQIGDLLVIVHGLNNEETNCLSGVGFSTLEVPFDWIDTTRPRPRRWQTFLKVTVFNLTSYSKIVFLDIDGIAITKLDFLFQYPSISAVKYKALTRNGLTYYNTGVMVIRPSVKLSKQVNHCWRFGTYASIWYGDDQLTEQELFLHCLQAEFRPLPGNCNCKTRRAASRPGCAFVHRKWWGIKKGHIYEAAFKNISIATQLFINNARPVKCFLSLGDSK